MLIYFLKLISRDTNAYAKLWLRILKHQILQKKNSTKPGNFVLTVYDDMKGREVNVFYKLYKNIIKIS